MSITQTIGIIGLTEVGLALMVHLESCGFKTIGYDDSRCRTNEVRSGEVKVHDTRLARELKSSSTSLDIRDNLTDVLDVTTFLYITCSAKYQPQDYFAFNAEQIGRSIAEIRNYIISQTPVEPPRIRGDLRSICVCAPISPGYVSVVVSHNIQDLTEKHGFDLHYLPLFVNHGTEFADIQGYPTLFIGSTETKSDTAQAIAGHMSKISGHLKREPHFMSLIEAEVAALAKGTHKQMQLWFCKIMRQLCQNTQCDSSTVLSAVLENFSLMDHEYDTNKYQNQLHKVLAFRTLLQKNGINGDFLTSLEATDDRYVSFVVHEMIPEASDGEGDVARAAADEVAEGEGKNDDGALAPPIVQIENIGCACAQRCIDHSFKIDIAEEFVKAGFVVLLCDSEAVVNKLRARYGPLFTYKVVS